MHEFATALKNFGPVDQVLIRDLKSNNRMVVFVTKINIVDSRLLIYYRRSWFQSRHRLDFVELSATDCVFECGLQDMQMPEVSDKDELVWVEVKEQTLGYEIRFCKQGAAGFLPEPLLACLKCHGAGIVPTGDYLVHPEGNSPLIYLNVLCDCKPPRQPDPRFSYIKEMLRLQHCVQDMLQTR